MSVSDCRQLNTVLESLSAQFALSAKSRPFSACICWVSGRRAWPPTKAPLWAIAYQEKKSISKLPHCALRAVRLYAVRLYAVCMRPFRHSQQERSVCTAAVQPTPNGLYQVECAVRAYCPTIILCPSARPPWQLWFANLFSVQPTLQNFQPF